MERVILGLLDVIKRLHAGYVFERRAKVLAQMLSGLIPPGSSVLDIGSGNGAIADLIMKGHRTVRIRGIEVLKRPDCLIECDVFDGNRLPYGDASFDVSMFVDVLHHAPNIEELIREAARTSRCVLIKDHIAETALDRLTLKFLDWVANRPYGVRLIYNYMDRGRWAECLSNAGLRVVSWEEHVPLYPFPFGYVFGRKLHFVALLEKSKKS